MNIPCRLIHENGTVATLRIYWSDDCPNCLGRGGKGFHNAEFPLTQSDTPRDWKLGGEVADYPEDAWPTKCAHCGLAAPPPDLMADDGYGSLRKVLNRQVFRRKRYNTASGRPEPGDLYWADWLHTTREDGTVQCSVWSNCTDPRGHLYCTLPGGHDWDIQGRATNCTMPQDRTHRCWVMHGEPPNVHVDKSGHTCAAGGGSIAVPGYHGFLHHGRIT